MELVAAVSHPLYRMAQEWRRDHAIGPGFAAPRESLHPKVVQAIKFLEAEESRQREERMEIMRESQGQGSGRGRGRSKADEDEE